MRVTWAGGMLCAVWSCLCAPAQGDEFSEQIQPLLNKHCFTCHSTERQEGELDLEQFSTVGAVKQQPQVWQHVLEQLANNEMPPKTAPQLSPLEKQRLTNWIQQTLDEVALASAGDPGPIVLRRLSNMEYTYTLRDLMGVPSLDPAREFPADSAAGEGFTNAGAALVMSPALLTKYLDAAKELSEHLVLLPDGVRFSPSTSRTDWTRETLSQIREVYGHYIEPSEGKVAVGGTGLVSSSGGRIPLVHYLTALADLQSSEIADAGQIARLAAERGLSPRYLTRLWNWQQAPSNSPLLAQLQTRFKQGELTVAELEAWQNSLWRFTNVGHLGKVGGPTAWQEPVTPLAAQHEFRVTLPSPDDGRDLLLYLVAGNAGDGAEQDVVLWERPRLTTPGQPDLLLSEIPLQMARLKSQRVRVSSTVTRCLAAVQELQSSTSPMDLAVLARRHQVDADLLQGWLDLLGYSGTGPAVLEPLISQRIEQVGNYNFVRGWGGDNALSVLANSSESPVQIPGTVLPRSIVVHPAPQLAVVSAWRSPIAGRVTVSGRVHDAHTACGNGVTWSLEVRRGSTREILSAGQTVGDRLFSLGPIEQVPVRPGDVIALVIAAGGGDHVCDLTGIDFTVSTPDQTWNLTEEIVPDILAGNPHADRFGNAAVWYFLAEPERRESPNVIPEDSLLGRWRRASDAAERAQLAQQLEQLLQGDRESLPPQDPQRQLHQMLLAPAGPLLKAVRAQVDEVTTAAPDQVYGVQDAEFGQPGGLGEVAADSLAVQAPRVVEVRLPADLAAGREFVVTGRLHPQRGGEGSVQLQVRGTGPESVTTEQLAALQPIQYQVGELQGAWNSGQPKITASAPVIVHEGSAARRRLEQAFADFRELFPAALCYTTIVPVDEVVTLTLFHREDEPLMRLMLSDEERITLDRLWNELHFVSQSPLLLVDAYEQIWQYSTQDGPNAPEGDKRLEPLREPILRAAAEFQQLLVEVEPVQLEAVVGFAARAWRRPLTSLETEQLWSLYQSLRAKELPHETALRTVLTRILVSPTFLYRAEESQPGTQATPVNDWELATRLSYFLWSSCPDAELTAAAASGKLHEPDILLQQVRRMLQDDKVRRLATEFGCQWLHVRDLETLDEKSERHFPTFVSLRGDMQEETTRFFIDLFQHDRSLLNLLDADYTFVNGPLARHYGLTPETESWQRIEGVQAHGRGGILAFASTLARQSGASRTSPILRGNWLSEVVLGEKLPRPPKDVPVLPEETPEGLTERQLIERHSSDERCAGCHRRIDPFGFALEGFDAIGRARQQDAAGLPIDTLTRLPNGAEISGLEGLRSYLIEQRREDFLRQFCKKLLGYALGRSVQLSDQPLLDLALAKLQENEYRVSTVMELIVTSPQFREIRGQDYAVSH